VHDVLFTEMAKNELLMLRRFDRSRILDAIDASLVHQPDVPTRHRKILQLESPWGDLPLWELRVGDYRVLYDLEGSTVTVRAVRHKGRKTTEEVL